MTLLKITPSQVEILEWRTRIPDTIFEVFEDTDGLAGKYSEAEITTVCGKLEVQFAKGFVDLSQFENQALLIEVLDDITNGCHFFASLEYDGWSPQKIAAYTKSAERFDAGMMRLGIGTDTAEYIPGKVRPINT